VGIAGRIVPPPDARPATLTVVAISSLSKDDLSAPHAPLQRRGEPVTTGDNNESVGGAERAAAEPLTPAGALAGAG